MKADEVRLYALRGGLKKQSVCYTHFHSNKVFRGDLKENNPDIINPINQSEDIDKRSDYSRIIRDNTECDFIIQQNPEKKEIILELIDIIVDTVCSTKPTIRVNGEDIPHDIVKSTFLKLNSSHIEYVLDAMDNNVSDVRNIRSYLTTALYNSRLTLNSYWKSRVNHDMNKR